MRGTLLKERRHLFFWEKSFAQSRWTHTHTHTHTHTYRLKCLSTINYQNLPVSHLAIIDNVTQDVNKSDDVKRRTEGTQLFHQASKSDGQTDKCVHKQHVCVRARVRVYLFNTCTHAFVWRVLRYYNLWKMAVLGPRRDFMKFRWINRFGTSPFADRCSGKSQQEVN